MNKVHLINTFVVIGVLMAMALYGMVFVEFVFTCIVCMGVAAILFYTFLAGAYLLDKIIDRLYSPQ